MGQGWSRSAGDCSGDRRAIGSASRARSNTDALMRTLYL